MKSYIPSIKMDFLPPKREMKNGAVSTAKGLTIMSSAALGVYLSEKMQVPGDPEGTVSAKIAEWTKPLGKTGQRAAVVATTTGTGAAVASQLDRLRPEDVVSIDGEEVPASKALDRAEEQVKAAKSTLREVKSAHEGAVSDLAESVGMEADEDTELSDVTDQLVTALVAQKREKAALENELDGPPTQEDLRTQTIEDPEVACVLLETAETPSDLERLLEGEEREEVRQHANHIRENAAVAA